MLLLYAGPQHCGAQSSQHETLEGRQKALEGGSLGQPAEVHSQLEHPERPLCSPRAGAVLGAAADDDIERRTSVKTIAFCTPGADPDNDIH